MREHDGYEFWMRIEKERHVAYFMFL